MPQYLRKDRLKTAVLNLADWRASVQSQASAHLFPFLALVGKGGNSNTFVKYDESDDFEFFDKYFRAGGHASTPYFDPLNRRFRIESHPHSNAATLRKNTFQNRWEAGESKIEGGSTFWKLSANVVDIIAQRVMTRGGEVTRVNVLDLSCWLFRREAFPDTATSDSLLAKFRASFSMQDTDFDQLFEYIPEPKENLFGPNPLTEGDINSLVNELVIDPEKILEEIKTPASASKISTQLNEDDPILSEVRNLIALGSSGIILRGSPGTSKSWYAWNIALALCKGDQNRIFRVQFHPSYGYEDFVEGYVPDEDSKSGFKVERRTFLKAIQVATKSKEPVVFIIDEINRGDTSRILGELLTYLERGWRGHAFTLKLSGETMSIPNNLVVIATMNPHDRSISQLDMALLRRFDHVDIRPSRERVSEFLQQTGLKNKEADLILNWFDQLQKLLPFGIGHAYFLGIRDLSDLNLIWRYRVLPFCQSLLEFEPERLENISKSFDALQRRLRGGDAPEENQ